MGRRWAGRNGARLVLQCMHEAREEVEEEKERKRRRRRKIKRRKRTAIAIKPYSSSYTSLPPLYYFYRLVTFAVCA